MGGRGKKDKGGTKPRRGDLTLLENVEWSQAPLWESGYPLGIDALKAFCIYP